MPVFIVLEDRIAKCGNQFHSKEDPYSKEEKNVSSVIFPLSSNLKPSVQIFNEAEKVATDLLSNTKADWSLEFREEYYKLVNKVSYDAKLENVKDMTERVNSLKKLAMVLSKVICE